MRDLSPLEGLARAELRASEGRLHCDHRDPVFRPVAGQQRNRYAQVVWGPVIVVDADGRVIRVIPPPPSSVRWPLPRRIRIPNLGSHILTLVRRHLPRDWTRRYSTNPVLVESFVETPRFTGGVHRASCWIPCVGTTRRRGR